jgi:uncharacterized protein YndB with AHSA1/START domain
LLFIPFMKPLSLLLLLSVFAPVTWAQDAQQGLAQRVCPESSQQQGPTSEAEVVEAPLALPAPVVPSVPERRPPPAAELELALDEAPAPAVEIDFPRIHSQHSVEIDAPVEAVWAYVGDSTLATEWSVYFHHITPLGGGDGRVGALRRCFRRADEKGVRWDETVEEIVPLRLRRLKTFNVRGRRAPGSNVGEFDVWQIYEPLGPNRTRLTFATAPVAGSKRVTRFYFRAARGRTTRIFRENLENIAHAIEQGAAYQRIHPFDRPGRFGS